MKKVYEMDLSIAALRRGYKAGEFKPEEVMAWSLSRLDDADQTNVWTSSVDSEKAMAAAKALSEKIDDIDNLPLYGTVFSVKDNIDVEGEVTTAACPSFGYVAEVSATVVQAVINAGAMYLGKTNLDQFATGLVGTRSPFGTPRNPHNPDYIPGGSSAGAGVSVATGIVSFGFGTDTGGSGRVPACYNGVVGLKPAPGYLSRAGLVFACRSIDTASIYAADIEDAMSVFNVTSFFDPTDPLAISDDCRSANTIPEKRASDVCLAVPGGDGLTFFGNQETSQIFNNALKELDPKVSKIVAIDYDPFAEIGQMMFFGPLLAERYASVGEFIKDQPEVCDPVVRDLILSGAKYTGVETFESQYRIAEIQSQLTGFWQTYDAMIVPTVGTLFTKADIKKDPLGPNFKHGYYTNFANPLGLSAIAVPFGRTQSNVPYGVTFLAPGGREAVMQELAACLMDYPHPSSA